MFPDNEFFRRKHGREGLPSGDDVRFFMTVASPDTTYPTTGNVVYGQLLRDVSFVAAAGSSITSTATADYAWLGISIGNLPALSTVVIARKIGARWWIQQ